MVSELREKAEKLRERLLDLSGKNSFIRYSHNAGGKNPNKQRFLRIVNEIPELLIQKLRKGSRYQLQAQPSQAEYEFNLPYITPKTAALYKKSSTKIQVYEKQPKFGLSCNTIRLESNSFEKDKGINVLYVAIGFLKYPINRSISTKSKSLDPNKKQKKPPTEAYAPLLLYPVKITREKTASGFNYYLETSEEELVLNRSLNAKLVKEEGISLPELKYASEDQPLIEQYFKEINSALLEKNEIENTNKWELKRWATLGIFKFGKLAIFEDTNFDSWSKNPLESKQLVQDFINGVPSNSVEDIGDMNIFQDEFEKIQLVDQIPKLISEADSTQYKVIVKALEGKSMAIQGPPGTGKSQTITNIIGGLLVKNKKVLFAADKFTALEVVKQRLSNKNLGQYILELHNATKSKKDFHENLSARLAKPKTRFFRDNYVDSFAELKNLRKELNEHVNIINKKINLNDKKTTVFEIMWRDILNKLNLGDVIDTDDIKDLEDKFINNLFKNIEKQNFALVKSNLDLLGELTKSSQSDQFLKLSEIKGLPETSDDLSQLTRISNNLLQSLKDFEIKLNQENVNYSSLIKIDKDDLENDINNLQELISEKFINKEFTLKEDIKDRLSKIYKLVVEREDQENYIEKWAKPLLENENKFDLFENCLSQIDGMEPEDKKAKIKDLLNDIKFIYEIFSGLLRDISKEDRRLNNLLTFDDLINSLKFFNHVCDTHDEIYDDLIFLLVKSKDLVDLENIIKKIKQIQKNSNDGIKIKKSGLDLQKILEIGPEKLNDYSETIKNASIFDCILNKEVRNVKSSWKNLSIKGFKRPSLARMAKLYLIASNYCENILKEEEADFQDIEINKLREISFNLTFDSGLEEIMNNTKNKFQDITIVDNLYKVFINNKSIYKDLKLPVFQSLLDKNFYEVRENSSSYATDIFTSITLLGEEPSKNILETSFSNISLILEDIKSLKSIIKKLELTIKDSDIFCEEDLQYSVTSKDINRILELFGNIDLSSYISLLNKNIENPNLSASLKFLTRLRELINYSSDISSNFDNKILSFYLKENLNQSDYLDQINELKKSLNYLINIQNDLDALIEFKRLQKNISKLGLNDGISQLISISDQINIKVSDIFEYLYVKYQIREISLDQKLNKFSGKATGICREQFCDLDRSFIQETSLYIDKYLDRNTVAREDPIGLSQSPKNLREGDLIEHEINKKRNHLPFRKLFSQALISLQRLKPCFMMSPSSASQCLPKKCDIFDVLIIDEASQMNPEEAIGLIARCKQVIIVGDEKQLPPDNRWMTRDDDDDDDDYEETVDLEISESILELANKVLRNSRDCALGWHYRSRHHSLINFSNKSFYENRLTVFPSNKIGSEIKLVKVENPYYHASKNLPEVNTVIEVLKKQIEDDPSKTILIASTNRAQAGLIEDEIDILRNKDTVFNDYMNLHKGELERLLVKNLETVQGEERDIVIISTVYGPDQNGVVANRFGDLVKAGGERRLNVLLTRAKEKVYLVTSLQSGDIRVNPEAITGKRYLRDYLSYAETGIITDTSVRKSGEPENDFEAAIMSSLQKRGYEVDAQIGCLNYRIDLAIKDPRDKSKYLLAVECDGATYHSGYSARVHDRLRQQVLEGLGWDVFRIWSTDWWRSPEQELQLLDQEIKELLSRKKIDESIPINEENKTDESFPINEDSSI